MATTTKRKSKSKVKTDESAVDKPNYAEEILALDTADDLQVLKAIVLGLSPDTSKSLKQSIVENAARIIG